MSIGVKEYLETLEYISALYDAMNQALFDGVLDKPVLTLHPDEKNKTYSWLTKDKLWKKTGNEEGMYEMNLSAQFLNRPISEIAATLVHEMCHQWSKENGFQDTARSGSFHNKLFREIAERHGLRAELIGGRGWANTSLNEQGQRTLENFLAEHPNTLMYREMPLKAKRVRDISVRKYVCPDCKASVRATKAVNVWCGDCKTQFKEEEN